jgi:hypothetical protein
VSEKLSLGEEHPPKLSGENMKNKNRKKRKRDGRQNINGK